MLCFFFSKISLTGYTTKSWGYYGISKFWGTVFCKAWVLWIQLISQFNFRRQAIHKVRIKSIWNFFLKQHLPKSCIYCSVIPTKKLLSLLGLKFSSRFIFKWESEHKKSVVNSDWENDIFFNQSEDTTSTFYSRAKLCYNSKEICTLIKIF